MLSAKRNRLVGLDIGSKTIKAAEIVESKKGFVLSKFGMSDIAPGLIEDGAIKDPEAVADTLKSLFKSYGIKNSNVAVSIGGYSVIVKKISVPTATEEQLQDTIHFEAEQYIPFDINDVNLDFQILGENENNPDVGKRDDDGDMAIRVALHYPTARVVGIDASAPHLAIATSKARSAGVQDRVRFQQSLTPLGIFDGIDAILRAIR